MVNKVLRGSTCGSLNLPANLGCDKCKPSLERLRDTGKIRKRKIKTHVRRCGMTNGQIQDLHINARYI